MRCKNISILILIIISVILVWGDFVYVQADQEVKINTYYPDPYARYGTIEVLDFAEGDDTSPNPSSGVNPDWRVDGLNVDYLDGYSAEDFVYKHSFDNWLTTECCWALASEWAGVFTGVFSPHCPSGYFVSTIFRDSVDAAQVFFLECCKFATIDTPAPGWLPTICDLAAP